ncbi:hypothetical protein DACRYDRAFT_100106, partial [Dacryopinax primogenitus]
MRPPAWFHTSVERDSDRRAREDTNEEFALLPPLSHLPPTAPSPPAPLSPIPEHAASRQPSVTSTRITTSASSRTISPSPLGLHPSNFRMNPPAEGKKARRVQWARSEQGDERRAGNGEGEGVREREEDGVGVIEAGPDAQNLRERRERRREEERWERERLSRELDERGLD